MRPDSPLISPESLAAIVASARRLGMEIDQEEALQWLTNITSWQTHDALQVDARVGVFGHKVVMLDFSPEELAYFREIGRLVEFADQPGVVETALALSGSAAQSKIQTYPGDCDYFERVNIIAPTTRRSLPHPGRPHAREGAGDGERPDLPADRGQVRLLPLRSGREGGRSKAGSPIAWKPAEIAAGQIEGFRPDGDRAVVRWDEVAAQPGWCKLDWVVADPVRGRLANASNMLDVTWEAPDGAITPLDGYLDPYFQEVYLEAESVPIFSKLAQHVSADALDDYVAALEHEVKKYLTKDINYGKAAKRMYNIFRLTGRYAEATFLRELFDEPTTMLYQVWSLIRTLDDDTRAADPASPPSNSSPRSISLILAVIDALEGGGGERDRTPAAAPAQRARPATRRDGAHDGSRSRAPAGDQHRQQLLPRSPGRDPAHPAVHGVAQGVTTGPGVFRISRQRALSPVNESVGVRTGGAAPVRTPTFASRCIFAAPA